MRKKIWKFINKKRNKRDWKENNIGKNKERLSYMNLLEGKKGVDKEECMKTITEEIKIREKMEPDLEQEEIYAAVRIMKLKKAADIDGIPIEAWRPIEFVAKRLNRVSWT